MQDGMMVGGLYTLLLMALYMIFHTVLTVSRLRKWTLVVRRKNMLNRTVLPALYRLTAVSPGKPVHMEYGQCLRACGWTMDPGAYLLGVRIIMLLCAMVVIALQFGKLPDEISHLRVWMQSAAIALLALLYWDRTWLEWSGRRRRRKMVEEIYIFSRQLLYFRDSRANLHHKLIRCISFTQSLQKDFLQLTREWYTDAEWALTRFEQRLGTPEAHSFTETLNALRLNESQAYYELLRQRIDEFKDKSELLRDSRHESMSYVLYIVAGIPVFHTFRVFMHPWIYEGRQLLGNLTSGG